MFLPTVNLLLVQKFFTVTHYTFVCFCLARRVVRPITNRKRERTIRRMDLLEGQKEREGELRGWGESVVTIVDELAFPVATELLEDLQKRPYC